MTYPAARTQERPTNAQKEWTSNKDLKPLKGGFMVLNETVHSFIDKAVHDIGQTFSDERAELEPEEVLRDLVMGTFDDPSGLTWYAVEDKFGSKAYAAIPYAVSGQPGAAGEFRVSVVLKNSVLNWDIRAWGQY